MCTIFLHNQVVIVYRGGAVTDPHTHKLAFPSKSQILLPCAPCIRSADTENCWLMAVRCVTTAYVLDSTQDTWHGTLLVDPALRPFPKLFAVSGLVLCHGISLDPKSFYTPNLAKLEWGCLGYHRLAAHLKKNMKTFQHLKNINRWYIEHTGNQLL